MPTKRKNKNHSNRGTQDSVGGVQAANSELIRVLKEVTQCSDKIALFPNGITKIEFSIKVSGDEFAVTVEGPQAKGSFEVEQQAEAPDVTFSIKQRVGRKARGRLVWPAKGLSSNAVSGDSGHDAINIGLWEGIAFQERPGDAPYCDQANNCWFSVFRDAYGRTGMGIHPDGGTPDATLGCIGISATDTRSWHDALKSVNGGITCQVKDDGGVEILDDDSVSEVYETEAKGVR